MKMKYGAIAGTCLISFLVLSTGFMAQTARVPDHFLRERGVMRATPSAVNAAVFGEQGRSVRLNLFADVQLTVTLDHAENQGPNLLAWTGHVEGTGYSSATFVVSGSEVTGSINLGNGKVYQIRKAEDGTQWALEVDQSRFPRDEGDAIPAVPVSSGSNRVSPRDIPAAADDGSTIDVIVLYTAAARIAAGGISAMQQLVQLGIAETNTAYLNSGILQRVRLVDSEELNYTESTVGIQTDLQTIPTLSTVSALREQYGADLVSLWVSTSENICGIGYELANVTSSPTALSGSAFSVVELDCATGYYSFGHEMGHNMGAHHAKDDLNADGSVPMGVYPYSNGYKQTSGSNRFRTVMAYDCTPTCVRIQYFSNPSITYQSMPVGIDPNSPQGADNALTLNNTRTIVANFRTSIAGSTGGTTQAPILAIATPTETITTGTITISGTATGRGNNGISSVTVNGASANNGTASGSGVANWSLAVTLSPGANVITVIARDNTAAQNSATAAITITYLASSSVTSATASANQIFPQFADGTLADGSYFKTTVMISNPSSSAGANCSLQLHGVTLPDFSLSYPMGPSGWVIASTSGQSKFQSGYATLQCTAAVEAQLLYSFYAASGTKISEATVFSSPSASSVQTLADETGGAKLGLAVANDSDQTVTYTITVTNATGKGSLTLGPRSASAQFVDDIVPGVPTNNVGQVVVSSSTGRASVIGLRFTGSVFTTIPQTFPGASSSTSSSYHVFPQFADGKFSDGSYFRTTRINSNPNLNSASSCNTVLYGLTTSNNSVFSDALTPGGFIDSATAGTQPLQSGYADMQCSSQVDAEMLYSFYAANGVKLSEATVFSSPPAKILQILSDSREGAQVGLAIANDTDLTNTYVITVYDANGAVVGTASQNLAARTSIAKYVNDFVPLPPNHYGPVVVSSTGTVSIIGLRFTGAAFTTIPATIVLASPISATPVVTVTNAFTTDTNGTAQNTFNPGQTLFLVMTRNNSLTTQVLVEAHYTATGPSSYPLTNTLVIGSPTPAGTSGHYIDVPISPNAPLGTYTFTALVLYDGISSSQSITFTVAAPVTTTSPTITVKQAYAVDINSNVITSVNRGQVMGLVMDVMNSLSSSVNVDAHFKVTGPSGYVLVDQDFGSTAIDPGLGSYYIVLVPPAIAPTGTYTFQATVTYNGASSTASSTFTLN
jgi:peptidyl-Asp metalloendopeptidase